MPNIPRKRPKREPYSRREGTRLKPDVLDAMMAARGVGSRDVARLTGLDLSTITAVRKGSRVRLSTVHKIVALLDALPVNKTVAALVGIDVPAQNGEAKNKKTGARSSARRSKEISRGGGQPRAQR